MRLSDIMSEMGLESYAEVGLVLFLIAFLAVVIRVLFFSRKKEMDRAANIPLDDFKPSTPRNDQDSTPNGTTPSET